MGRHSSKRGGAKRKRVNINGYIALVLVVVGLGVLLYPVVATQWNNFQQSRAAAEYSKLEKDAPPEALNEAWDEAQTYNKKLGQISVSDAWTTSDDQDSPEYKRYEQYLSVLDQTDAMGRIVDSVDRLRLAHLSRHVRGSSHARCGPPLRHRLACRWHGQW